LERERDAEVREKEGKSARGSDADEQRKRSTTACCDPSICRFAMMKEKTFLSLSPFSSALPNTQPPRALTDSRQNPEVRHHERGHGDGSFSFPSDGGRRGFEERGFFLSSRSTAKKRLSLASRRRKKEEDDVKSNRPFQRSSCEQGSRLGSFSRLQRSFLGARACFW
jgi:hypothetical protein